MNLLKKEKQKKGSSYRKRKIMCWRGMEGEAVIKVFVALQWRTLLERLKNTEEHIGRSLMSFEEAADKDKRGK